MPRLLPSSTASAVCGISAVTRPPCRSKSQLEDTFAYFDEDAPPEAPKSNQTASIGLESGTVLGKHGRLPPSSACSSASDSDEELLKGFEKKKGATKRQKTREASKPVARAAFHRQSLVKRGRNDLRQTTRESDVDDEAVQAAVRTSIGRTPGKPSLEPTIARSSRTRKHVSPAGRAPASADVTRAVSIQSSFSFVDELPAESVTCVAAPKIPAGPVQLELFQLGFGRRVLCVDTTARVPLQKAVECLGPVGEESSLRQFAVSKLRLTKVVPPCAQPPHNGSLGGVEISPYDILSHTSLENVMVWETHAIEQMLVHATCMNTNKPFADMFYRAPMQSFVPSSICLTEKVDTKIEDFIFCLAAVDLAYKRLWYIRDAGADMQLKLAIRLARQAAVTSLVDNLLMHAKPSEVHSSKRDPSTHASSVRRKVREAATPARSIASLAIGKRSSTEGCVTGTGGGSEASKLPVTAKSAVNEGPDGWRNPKKIRSALAHE